MIALFTVLLFVYFVILLLFISNVFVMFVAESDIYIDADDVVIEEVETDDLLENEISQFCVYTPESTSCDPNLTRTSVIASTSSYVEEEPILPEHEEMLIKKLINGEIAFC